MNLLDSDKDGQISLQELKAALENQGQKLSDKELQFVIK
jgi:Ca2+-binding EF-hand superfamily protein